MSNGFQRWAEPVPLHKLWAKEIAAARARGEDHPSWGPRPDGDDTTLSGWRVMRHSGRGSPSDDSAWAERFVGSEKEARAHYDKIVKAMRQGGVRLLRPDGSIESERHEPRLRTRW